ncbi:VWA domain-containing protein [Methylobacillus gramineus]|uniref:vWA domain-containing protein n=1 Tax=Methylobacillus gramineus TaxID=755169 RepID=UPI001CFFD19C|nr:vWA domain-containing protein [Methylobacillus gramineus]MCB5184976.1 VWA domain-containing protein [Methylobacillus gramineus]
MIKLSVSHCWSWVKDHYESALYLAVVILLLLAIFKPQIQLKQEVHNYLLLADVSQSMNAEDVKLDGKNVSRIAYTRHLMRKLVETSPCGTYFSLGVFAAEDVALLFMPLETCANYDVIVDAIDHLEWRMSWRGNSRLSFGVKGAAKVFDSLNAPARLLFFTDGDEAPKVNAINKLDLSDLQIGENVVFVGVGGNQDVPIPRYNSNNQWIGYWSSDAKENSAGAVGITYNDTSKDDPDPPVASADYDRYLSKLDAEYLQVLAKEIDGQYIHGDDAPAFYSFVQKQKPAASFVTAYSVRWIYMSLALLLILASYLPNLMAIRKSRVA